MHNIPADNKHDVTDGAILLERADYFLSVGSLEQARYYYEQLAVLCPDEPASYTGLGIVALRNHQLDDAQLAFRVACRLDPMHARAYEGLAMTAQQKGDYETAFDMYLKCLELDPDNLSALLGLFQTSSRMGSFGRIIYYLEMYLKKHPDDVSVLFSLATLYIKEDRFDTAQKLLRDILCLEPDNKDAKHLLEEVQQHLARVMS
ncbi:MAG TPA: tetratricopeptide repeat protein [Anaerohalosphaeraceae bacterium]|nr:tetratricopeptide repeat protein [Anaerohalosphaeraceae bacterium]HRS71077.1 tetratricopeptide repeat protein [Anaerohalosphaeraceae bacterium]